MIMIKKLKNYVRLSWKHKQKHLILVVQNRNIDIYSDLSGQFFDFIGQNLLLQGFEQIDQFELRYSMINLYTSCSNINELAYTYKEINTIPFSYEFHVNSFQVGSLDYVTP